MAQVYTFTDSNGEVRLMAEIDPAPGGSQPAVEVLGPYTVNYNTPGLTDNFVLLDTLTSDVLLIHAAVIVTQTWDAAATLEVTVDPNVTNSPLWGAADVSLYQPGYGGWPGPANTFACLGAAGTQIVCDAFGATGLGSGQVKIFVLTFPLA